MLASRSPQRRAILEQLGIDFELQPADIPERQHGAPEQVARENALAKARAVAVHVEGSSVLGVDTVVTLDDRLYGKAADQSQAREFLEALSGRTHEVWSAVALIGPGGEREGAARTAVSFRRLPPDTIDWYLSSGEWRDRAGAYAIQGRGAALVERINGDFWNVVGLPVALLLEIAPELIAPAG